MAEVDLRFPQFAYGATKAALEQITTSMAADLALRKVPVRINGITLKVDGGISLVNL